MTKKIRIAALAACSLLALPSLSLLGGCASSEAVVLRVYNWEEYIDEGGKGSFIYDELHETDEQTNKVTEIESELVNADYMARYEREIGIPFDKTGSDVIDDFEHWYEKTYGTPVRVEYSTFGTNEDMYNQLKLGNRYDLVCPSEYMIMKLAAENMLEPLDEAFFDTENELNYYVNNVSDYIAEVFNRPSALTVNGQTHSLGEYAAGYMWGTTGLVYNPEKVNPEDLERDGWAIMLNPDYKGKVTTKDNVRDSYFVALAIHHREELLALKELFGSDVSGYNAEVTRLMNDVSDQTIDGVEKILHDMKKNIFGFETDTGKSDMVKGTIYMNFAWSGDAVYAMNEAEEQGVSLNYYIPEESANLFFDGWAIPHYENYARPENVKHAAQAFINFMAKPEYAVRNSYYIGYSSVIAGEEMFEYVNATYSAEEGDDAESYDLSYFFGQDGDYVISAPSDQLSRQLYAQYPPRDTTPRCAVMNYYGKEKDDQINELWTRVKGESLDAWAIVVLVLSVSAILLFVLFKKIGHKIELPHKIKKGYVLVKQEKSA